MSTEQDLYEQVRVFLPKYLTPSDCKELWEGLASFPEIKSFYLHRADLREHLLQGDGWRGFVVIDFFTGERKTVSGMVLSNSCDLVPRARELPGNVLFVPLIALRKYVDRLLAFGKSKEQVTDTIRTIQHQQASSIFYLPACDGMIEESMVLLDDIHAHPRDDFLAREPSRLFTLNQIAFYLFLMKLSIHFSRFLEGIRRFDDVARSS